MGKKLIDDEKLLNLLKEGKKQKDIAELFGVSPVAICKRLKRLLPALETPHFNNLTKREQAFSTEIAHGKTQTQAALNSFDVSSMASARSIGSQLMSRDEIKMSVKELMNYHGLTKSYRMQKLKHHVDNRDPNVSLKALDQSFKLDGSYAPEKHVHVNISDTMRQLTEVRKQNQERLKEMVKIRDKIRIIKIKKCREEGLNESEILEIILNPEYSEDIIERAFNTLTHDRENKDGSHLADSN